MAINREELELLFCKEKQKAESSPAEVDTKRPNMNFRPKEVNLLDVRTLQNVGIALARLKKTPTEIREAVMSMDQALTFESIITLRGIAPTAEDVSAISQYDGDTNLLGKVEKVFLEIMNVPEYAKRLDSWIYKLRFESTYEILMETVSTVANATSQVKESAKLRKLLEVVLAIGNYLNGGTARGGSYGFKLDALSKLATVKSLNNKKTLMNYLAMWCERNDPSLLQFPDDVNLAEAASRISLAQLTSNFEQVKVGWKQLCSQVNWCRYLWKIRACSSSKPD